MGNNFAYIDGNNLYRGVNNSGLLKRTDAPITYLNEVNGKSRTKNSKN